MAICRHVRGTDVTELPDPFQKLFVGRYIGFADEQLSSHRCRRLGTKGRAYGEKSRRRLRCRAGVALTIRDKSTSVTCFRGIEVETFAVDDRSEGLPDRNTLVVGRLIQIEKPAREE